MSDDERIEHRDSAGREHAYPPDASTPELRERFDLAVAVAGQLLGDEATSGEVWSMGRALFRSDLPTGDQSERPA